MENKYYKPDIEEFHVGFEYEVEDLHDNLIDRCWRRQVFEGEYATIREWLETNDVRVKYLDQDDIESLGFTLDADQSGVLERNGITKSYRYQNKETFTGCCIDFMSHGKIKIFLGNLNSYRSMLRFHGTIKNKSELKQVLKMIGYGE